ncbi:YodC family protein [Pseudolabrys sp. FHR47]|uniref:YodC family protein n=1 Tax=Pseudolabrys sp. FHR47 TaxID=2562284 RepID=UPI0010BE64C2|nr:DUF2158 domain-containing protein [Pseudolabrys sp. FHR47]
MKFKVGDVVQLNSGGPRMTVLGNGVNENGKPVVGCSWFDGVSHCHAVFPEESVRPPRPSKLARWLGLAPTAADSEGRLRSA